MMILVLQKTVYGANVVIFEGIMTFASPELLKVTSLTKLLLRNILANIEITASRTRASRTLDNPRFTPDMFTLGCYTAI